MRRHLAGVAAICALAVLAACGGGGGGGGGGFLPIASAPAVAPATADAEVIVASSTVAGLCAAPRFGVDPDTGAAFPDRPGSLADEKRWLRGWINETYLWYAEVPTGLQPAAYATPIAYFAALKTPAVTASGRAKDRFHFTYDTAVYRALSQSGVSAGYGMEIAFLSSTVPRDLRVAYVEPGAAAAVAGIGRGVKLLEVDGVDVVSGTDTARLNAGLTPAKAGEQHGFKLGLPDGSTRSVTLTSANVTSTPVQNVKTIDTASGRVGYLQFNDHNEPAEAQLISAVNQFKTAGIADLVLDMRYNGGGLLAVASELAFMVATPAATQGRIFERLLFNDKNPFGLNPALGAVPFYGTTRGYSTTAGQALPQLGLSRVTVLTGPDTCSASESVVNSLRGVGVAVNLVGGATCGKPYGFYPQDNCGTTYFAIQFQGVNAQGFGDYGDGFAPTCAVADDFGHALGDPAEARLAAALSLRSGGACPAAGNTKTAIAGAAKTDVGDGPYLRRSPARENRVLDAPSR
ncbi:S41 family peptidase [Variovorax fucosicus]|uniref:S41 family peptidase n=1 Tax=Variovorax fucosicus TaxID=3053517 RepID=UPI00257677B7|nr:S41 family peptidase [Variovorax sp. J22G47]MDM0055267.1 S41 family peptidase [Variovorax sp. J22G47]